MKPENGGNINTWKDIGRKIFSSKWEKNTCKKLTS